MERRTLLLSFDGDFIDKMQDIAISKGYSLNDYIENILKIIVPVVEPIPKKVELGDLVPFEHLFIEKNFKIISYKEAEAAIVKAMNLTLKDVDIDKKEQ